MNSRAPKFALFALAVLLITISSAPALSVSADGGLTISWTKIFSSPAIGVDWSPDGNSIVFGDADSSQVDLLNWQTGALNWSTPFSGADFVNPSLFSVRWSPDGRSIATNGGEGNIYTLNPKTGALRLLQKYRNEFAYVAVDWSPDSNAIAALNSDGFINIISLQTGAIVQTIDIAGGDNERGEGLLYAEFNWSPDGNLFAAPHLMKDTAGGQPVMGFWDRAGNIVEAYTQENLTDSAPTSPCSTYAFLLNNAFDVQWANDSRLLLFQERMVMGFAD